jgi:hypothetical protein
VVTGNLIVSVGAWHFIIHHFGEDFVVTNWAAMSDDATNNSIASDICHCSAPIHEPVNGEDVPESFWRASRIKDRVVGCDDEDQGGARDRCSTNRSNRCDDDQQDERCRSDGLTIKVS